MKFRSTADVADETDQDGLNSRRRGDLDANVIPPWLRAK